MIRDTDVLDRKIFLLQHTLPAAKREKFDLA
jgi:hypothetical protein